MPGTSLAQVLYPGMRSEPQGAAAMTSHSSLAAPLQQLGPASRNYHDLLPRYSAPSLFRGGWRRRSTTTPGSGERSVVGDTPLKGLAGLTLLHEPSESRVDFIFVRQIIRFGYGTHAVTLTISFRRSTAYAGGPEKLGALGPMIRQPFGPSSGFPTNLASSTFAFTLLATTRTGRGFSIAP